MWKNNELPKTYTHMSEWLCRFVQVPQGAILCSDSKPATATRFPVYRRGPNSRNTETNSSHEEAKVPKNIVLLKRKICCAVKKNLKKAQCMLARDDIVNRKKKV